MKVEVAGPLRMWHEWFRRKENPHAEGEHSGSRSSSLLWIDVKPRVGVYRSTPGFISFPLCFRKSWHRNSFTCRKTEDFRAAGTFDNGTGDDWADSIPLIDYNASRREQIPQRASSVTTSILETRLT